MDVIISLGNDMVVSSISVYTQMILQQRYADIVLKPYLIRFF